MSIVERRAILLGMAAGAFPVAARAAHDFLPTPVFPDPDRIDLKFAEGYRPYRKTGYVIKGEKLGDKDLFHNYGHGGAGITTSWGSAQLLRDRLRAAGLLTPGSSVAVIGSGVIGMTTASVLADAHMVVTVYSRETFERTTSHVAGGQFAPADLTATDASEFSKMLATSYAEHVKRGEKFGVQQRLNYTLKTSDNLLQAVAASGKPVDFESDNPHLPYKLNRLPFEHMNVGGYVYPTLLVEPPVFLARLHDELAGRQIRFRPLTVRDRDSVLGLPEPLVINCLGAEARLLAPDDVELNPAHGVVALLPPQPSLQYLFSGIGYFFPRKNDIVIGGSFEQGREIGRLSSQDKARLMVKVTRAVFEGALPIPHWLAGKEQSLNDTMLRSVEDD